MSGGNTLPVSFILLHTHVADNYHANAALREALIDYKDSKSSLGVQSPFSRRSMELPNIIIRSPYTPYW